LKAPPTEVASRRLEFRILGPLEALRDGSPLSLGPRKQRTLLALLLLKANRLVSADQLIEELWAGRPPPGAVKTLRSYASRVRAALAPDSVLESRPGGYVLSLTPDQLDFLCFERLLSEGREALARGAAAEAAEQLRKGLSLWRGSALADVADGPFARVEASRLEELHLAGLEERIQADLELGRHAELLAELQALVAEQPLRERLWGQLMTALYRSGRQAEALATYRRARTLLADRFGLEPGPELRALEQQILRQELAPARPRGRAHNLPAQLTSFVGRERELEELGRLFAEARLVTMTGVGGCGKTRLALELAHSLLPRFPDGVCLVELAGLDDGELVAHAVASALEIDERSHRPVAEILADRLRQQTLLLLLDNCEHLLEACAQLAGRLLSACPQLRILATSRASLGIAGEVDYRVPPLPVPERGEEVTGGGSDAVRLFLERAPARRDLERSPEALAVVASICRDLDGLPLALELAAVRTRVFTVQEIAARLDDRFRFLRYWRRSPEPRHQTLGTTMAWSYDLLSEGEQAALRQLSVFAGGFTLGAAAAVCLEDDEDAELTNLVDASLVIAEPLDGTTRYRMLETVRRYGAERLDDARETAGTRRRHAEYFLALAEQAWQAIDTPAEGSWLLALEGERDNLRTALAWSLETEGDVGVRLARALGYSWRIHGHVDEGRGWLERALVRVGDERSDLRGDVLGWLGQILVRQNLFGQATDVLEEAVELAAEAGARLSQGRFLHSLAFAWREQGDYERAASLLEKALAVRLEIGDAAGLAWSMGSLADMAWLQGRTEESAELYERGWDFAREAGAPPALAVAYTHSRADLALLQGNIERGEQLAREALRLARELGDRWHIGLALTTLARAARGKSEPERANALLDEALRTLWDVRDMSTVAEALEIRAGVAADRCDATTATELQAAAATIRATHKAPLPPARKSEVERDLATLRSQLGAAAFEQAWESGARMNPEQAVAEALAERERFKDDERPLLESRRRSLNDDLPMC
jgi:predicted ATPase/DNA-binding SARP family transcriptional activator